MLMEECRELVGVGKTQIISDIRDRERWIRQQKFRPLETKQLLVLGRGSSDVFLEGLPEP